MEIEQLRERVEFLERLIGNFTKSDNYYFGKHLILADGANIKCSTGTGTKFGTATGQKIGFYNVTPVIQAGAIASPSADVTALKTAVDAIRVALTNFGITA